LNFKKKFEVLKNVRKIDRPLENQMDKRTDKAQEIPTISIRKNVLKMIKMYQHSRVKFLYILGFSSLFLHLFRDLFIVIA